jgi:hypothetical protein
MRSQKFVAMLRLSLFTSGEAMRPWLIASGCAIALSGACMKVKPQAVNTDRFDATCETQIVCPDGMSQTVK